MNALLYPTGIQRPRMVRLPVDIDYTDAVDATGWVADTHTAPWFPNGAKYTKVDSHLREDRPLKNCYTIVTSCKQRPAQINKCILGMFGIRIRGNVLVLRHARLITVQVTSMHPSEGQFVDAIVARYAKTGVYVIVEATY